MGPVLYIRSLFFNITFYLVLIIFLLGGLPAFFIPHKAAVKVMQLWGRTCFVLMRLFAGISVEIRGREHIIPGALLVACKHQSLWETFALLTLFDDPAIVLKKELTYIPLFGWFALKLKLVTVDRSAGSSALRHLIHQAKSARDRGRQIIIFPEGTRMAPGAVPDYKPGVAALYKSLDISCLPIALNSGLYWPRRSFLRHPGTIIMEILPPIKAGVSRKEFMDRLENAIEDATTRLVSEGRARDFQ
jgi:1-acyl-sn-glycerol-3-phosphate acyltransferase